MTNIDVEEGEPAAAASGTSALPGGRRPDADTVRAEALQQAIEPLRQAVLRLEARLDEIEAAQRDLKRQIADYAAGPIVSPASAELITGEIARQLEALIGNAAAPSDPLPLPTSDDRTARDAAADPLVMGAIERAIVRLTHRLEKLEEWRRHSRAPRQRSGLIGRLFES